MRVIELILSVLIASEKTADDSKLGLTKMIPITEVAKKAGIDESFLELYGKYMAKINLGIRKNLGPRKGKLILVTATNPTPAGEGKTTNSIGLSMALSALGHNAVVTLRQPSLGPVFGVKGGAAGGGKSRLEPFEQVNLFLTGDFPAVSAAHNLLSAMIDNYVQFDHQPEIDIRRTYWPRNVDMNDRALRVLVGGTMECRERTLSSLRPHPRSWLF